MRNLAAIALFAFGCLIGLKLADFDQSFRLGQLIQHRSLLTHGFMLPLGLFLAVHPRAGKPDEPLMRLFVQGLCLSTAVHLCFDLYPAGWGRWSRIFVPFAGWTSPLLSKIWLGAGALTCLYLACRSLRGLGGLALALLGLVASFIAGASTETRPPFYALMTLVSMALVAFLLPRPPHDPDSPSGDIHRWIRS